MNREIKTLEKVLRILQNHSSAGSDNEYMRAYIAGIKFAEKVVEMCTEDLVNVLEWELKYMSGMEE